jgi:acyl-CoA thioester hydrolase
MLTFETSLRVRYGETDKMGYVYYGIYAQYFEVGRTDFMRQVGITYKSLEEQGIIMPVISMNVKYHKPVVYDELLIIKTTIHETPTTRVTFCYEIFNEQKQLVTSGNTTLVFVLAASRRPVKAPDAVIAALEYINNLVHP